MAHGEPHDHQTIAQAATHLRTLAKELDDMAWTLTVRDVGRALSAFAQHLREDAQNLDLLALMVPVMENLPPDKKAEVNARLPQERAQGALD